MTADTVNAVTVHVDIVIPTIGRSTLQRLFAALDDPDGPAPSTVIVVDDRPHPVPPLAVQTGLTVRWLHSGGRGPAAARNLGWRAGGAQWVCFLDDDVVPQAGWWTALAHDLQQAEKSGAAGSQAVLHVPARTDRPGTDDEQRTQRLASARWITADMAYRRSALVAAGGFDERFTRAYREDSDLALRITRAGGDIIGGRRRSTHPVAQANWLSSIRAQAGNRDDALLRRKFGRGWRAAIGEGRGRLPAHVATTAAALLALLWPDRRVARAAGVGWLGLTAQFTMRRFLAGPRVVDQAWRLLITSALIPPVAVAHRVQGEWTFRSARREPPLAVLLDRDDTIIEDIPYLNDPTGVRPVAGAPAALGRLRERGLLLGIVSNQSGVAKGLITEGELAAVNARVDALLGPFGSWQVCLHDDGEGCHCRKPAPGMVRAAAAELGVDPRRCVLIGDTGGDVEAALAADADAVLVPTGRTLPHEISSAHRRARVAATLVDAVSMVLRDCR